MKKNFLTAIFSVVICTLTFNDVAAQKSGSIYNTALGLGIDFGSGGTYVGPSIKHFFTKNNVGKAEVLFGDASLLSLYYQYHGDIENAAGLKWTLGLGGTVIFYSPDVSFGFRPTAGLDYKIPNVPLAFEFDWRPYVGVSEGNDFEAARFGFGFRYCFK